MIKKALCLKTISHHHWAHQFDFERVSQRQIRHSHRRTRIKAFFANFAQQIAHCNRDIAKVNIYRTRFQTPMTNRAMVSNIVKFLVMQGRNTATRLLFIQKRLNQKWGCQNFISGRVKQISAWHVRRTNGFTFATAQAIFNHLRNAGNLRIFQYQRFRWKQMKRWRISIAQICPWHEFAAIKMSLWVNFFFVSTKRRDFIVIQIFQFRQPNAVFSGNNTTQRFCKHHNPRNRGVGCCNHFRIIRIDRNICVHIAIARMHVKRHKNARTQDFFMNFFQDIAHRRKNFAIKTLKKRLSDFSLPRCHNAVVSQTWKNRPAHALKIFHGQPKIFLENFSCPPHWHIQIFQKKAPTCFCFFHYFYSALSQLMNDINNQMIAPTVTLPVVLEKIL